MTETPERPELTEVAHRIVAAISQGVDDNRDESDRESIAKRYRELRISLGSFAEAAFQARVEFVQSALASSLGEPVSQEAPVISSASPLSEEALRVAFLAGVEDAVGPERCGAEYDAPSREYARRAIDRLSASAPSPE